MTIASNVVLRALNRYLFETTWSAPNDECGVNLQLYPVGEVFQTNTIILGTSSIPLPAVGQQYAVFWASYSFFQDSLIIPSNTWVATDQLGNAFGTLFHVYSETGLILPKAAVYIYHSLYSNTVYIAVVKAPLLKIVGIAAWSQLYLSIYRYSSQTPSPLTIHSYQVAAMNGRLSVTAGTVTTASTNAFAACPYGTFVYVNGYDHPPGSALTLSPGDYVDLYTDTTVFGIYTVDLTSTTTGYFSSVYQVYKQVLHCPKAVNPTKLVTTTELLTLTARRNTDQVGCFIHRNEKNGVTQITHTDIGINTDIVNAYRTSLGSADISIEVRLRSHGNTLIRDAGYIEYLYLCSDAQILTFLIGQGDPSLPFWTAAALEQSAYITDMGDTPALISAQTLTNYVDSIGYYTVISALCRHDKTLTIDALPVTAISIRKPLVLAGMPAYPLVYLNGTKLRDTQVDYANARRDKIVFSLTPDVYAEVGQTLTVELLESGVSIPTLFTPSSTIPSVTVPFGSVLVYQVNTLANPVTGYQTAGTASYAPILVPGSGTVVTAAPAAAGGTTLTFQSTAYGTTYLIQNAVYSRTYGLDITGQVTGGTPLHIELTTLCTDNTTVVPLLGYQTLAVYLNGRRLIGGIDYAANPLTDTSGNVAVAQLLLCNRSLLALTGSNYLEVIAHTSTEIIHTVGYVANNMLNVQNNTELWYAGLTTAFAGGSLLVNPTDTGDAIIPASPVANGEPFLLTAAIPSYVAAVLSGVTSAADDQRIATINTFLNGQPTINNVNALIIPSSWQLFSPYLTAIIHDASQSGTIIEYSNDPVSALFQAQFSAYNYLLTNDPTVATASSSVDLRYCDVFPVYKTVNVPDLNTYTILRRLATMMLSPDSDTLGEITND